MDKFMDLTPVERYELIGKIIDAMIYDEICVSEVRLLVEKFEKEGKIKSKFFPNDLVDNQENLEI